MLKQKGRGTGAVTLAGFIRAVRLTGKPIKDHRFVFFGAGSAAVGIAQMLCTWAQQEGCSEEEARKVRVHIHTAILPC